jgi:hypothetical protein
LTPFNDPGWQEAVRRSAIRATHAAVDRLIERKTAAAEADKVTPA